MKKKYTIISFPKSAFFTLKHITMITPLTTCRRAMSRALCLSLLFISPMITWGQTTNFVKWDFTPSVTSANYASSVTNQNAARTSDLAGSTLSSIAIVGGATAGPGNTFHRTTTWPTTSSAAKYLEFSITLSGGQNFADNAVNVSIGAQVSSPTTAARDYTITYGYGTSPTFATATNGIVTGAISTATTTTTNITIPAPGNTTTTILTVRMLIYGSTSGSGNFRIATLALTGFAPILSACTVPDNVTALTASNGSSQSTVAWTNGSCYDEIMVVASAAAFTAATPTGDGTGYTASSSSFTNASNTAFDGGVVVYKGVSSTVNVTSLTNGTPYNFKVFARKGTTWTTGVTASATPALSYFYWDADGNTSAATGGTGTWDNTSSTWRTPNATGTLAAWNTNTTSLDAVFEGTAGIITSITGGITLISPNFRFNTTGYTLATTGTSTTVLTGNIVLGNNVNLTLAPNVNTTIPASGTLSLGNVTGTGTAELALTAAQATTLTAARINIATANASIGVPITISSAGGTGNFGATGFVATAIGTSLTSAATITNNSAIKTVLGATSGNDLTVNAAILGTGDLQFSAGASGGAGTIILSAASNYSGATIFNAAAGGIVKLGIANAFPRTTDITMGNSTSNGGVLDLNGFNLTIGSLTNGVGGGSIRNNGLTDVTLTVAGATSPAAFTLAITDGTTNKTALTRSGTGSLTLTGTNTYTGVTTVTGGTLKLNKTGGTTIPITNNVNVTGGTLQISTNQIVNNLTVNGGNITVDDGVIFTITGTLTLTSGYITVGTGSVVASTIVGGSMASHVVTTTGTGDLKITAVSTTPVVFPVGISPTSYDPVTVTNTAGSDNFSATVKATFTTAPAGDINQVFSREWNVVSASTSATLGFTPDAAATPTTPPTVVTIGHYTGGGWVEVHSTLNAGTYSALFTSFSPFGVGQNGAFSGVPLSVELERFDVKKSHNSTILTWKTASEKNNAYFDIQRSTDGNSFKTISQVKGNGTTNKANEYTFTDINPSLNVNYYRLRQVDFDGTEAFSKVVSVVYDKIKNITIYPTIAADKVTIVSENDDITTFDIINMMGQIVQKGQFSTQTDLNITALIRGTYVIKINNQTFKFVKI